MNPLFNMDLPVEERAAETIKQMTLEEKVSQLVYKSAAIERLGIPAYHWWNECLHGVARCGTATVFPQAIGLAAMFDAEFLKRVAEAISDEIRGKYNAYQSIGDNSIYKGITEYAPNINIFRDPRWGRGQETYGEDPFLTAELGIAFIRGIQGEDEKYRKADANVKHYVVHSGPDELRHEIDVKIDVKIDEKQFRETYLYAFARCIREADVACVMGAYNRVNGAPCSGSTYLLKDILRDELGFKGYVVSDSFAIDDFHLHHKITATPVESAAMAFNHGCDQNGGTTFLFLTEAVDQGLVKEEDIDISVQRLLEERIRLGMFDSAEAVPFNKISDDVVDCAEFRRLAKEAAEKSAVLLKNKEKILPLENKYKTIAVIGPNADSRDVLLGNYSGTPSKYTTLLRGMQEEAEKRGVDIIYAEGCDLYKKEYRTLCETDLIPEAVLAARRSDISVLCLGLSPVLEGEEGEEGAVQCDREHLGLPGRQAELLILNSFSAQFTYRHANGEGNYQWNTGTNYNRYGYDQRSIGYVDILVPTSDSDGQIVRIACAHYDHGPNAARTLQSNETVTYLGLDNPEYPTLLLGDLNTSASSLPALTERGDHIGVSWVDHIFGFPKGRWTSNDFKSLPCPSASGTASLSDHNPITATMVLK